MKYKYMVIDSLERRLGYGTTDDGPTEPVFRLEFSNKDLANVLEHKYVVLEASHNKALVIEGKIIENRGNVVYIKCTKLRDNLRVPVSFDSYVYAISEDWKGRAKIKSVDLSCGGMSFICERKLKLDEEIEVTVPISHTVLVLKMKIIRIFEKDEKVYAATFYDMVHDEEVLTREAVFNLQLQNRVNK